MDIRQSAKLAVQHGEWFMVAVAVALSWLVVAVVVMLALASQAHAEAHAEAQVLASYTLCAATGACAVAQARTVFCPASAREQEEGGFLRWALAMHRAAAGDAGVALRSLRPRDVEIPRSLCVEVDARLLTR